MSIPMTSKRCARTSAYLQEVFGRQDEHLAGLMAEAVAAGLPDIAVSADVGRLLTVLTSMTRGRLALELGTLGGYSAIWIARGLAPRGRLITLELDPANARFARRQLERAGVASRVEVREGAALDLIPGLAADLGPACFDVVFIDAEKSEYPEYWRLLRPLVAPGGLVMVDNALGSSSWWIDDEDHPARQAVDRLNRAVAADTEFEAFVVPLRSGVLVARRKTAPGAFFSGRKS